MANVESEDANWQVIMKQFLQDEDHKIFQPKDDIEYQKHLDEFEKLQQIACQAGFEIIFFNCYEIRIKHFKITF